MKPDLTQVDKETILDFLYSFATKSIWILAVVFVWLVLITIKLFSI